MTRIIVDCMSGDNAPLEIVKGAVQGAELYNVSVLLVGCENTIRKIMRDENLSGENVEIYNTGDKVITMEDDPSEVMNKKDSSMATALSLLAEGKGDAVVSAGNTGALFTGATLIVRRIKGIRRAALGGVIPLNKPILLVDSGANTDVTPEILCDFAVMGNLFMKKVMGIQNPKTGLANNGSEEHKGTPVYVRAHEILKEQKDIDFTGNIEGRDIPLGKCDVIVCDGFTGNIILKMCEGFGIFIKDTLKKLLMKNTKSKIGALFLSDGISRLKKEMDYTEFGGAPFLGISKPVIKAHGSSNAKSISYCILQAKNYASSGIIDEISLFAQKRAEEKKALKNGDAAENE